MHERLANLANLFLVLYSTVSHVNTKVSFLRE